MFWEMYLQKKKRSKNGETFGLLFWDAAFACHIAAWEGMMYECAERGDKGKYAAYQRRIRNLFEKEYSAREIPKELEPGYFPEPKGWSGDA
jgi:hypothetical protein